MLLGFTSAGLAARESDGFHQTVCPVGEGRPGLSVLRDGKVTVFAPAVAGVTTSKSHPMSDGPRCTVNMRVFAGAVNDSASVPDVGIGRSARKVHAVLG